MFSVPKTPEHIDIFLHSLENFKLRAESAICLRFYPTFGDFVTPNCQDYGYNASSQGVSVLNVKKFAARQLGSGFAIILLERYEYQTT
jgi:hypothetical protein